MNIRSFTKNKKMNNKLLIPTFISMLLLIAACHNQEASSELSASTEKLDPVITKKADPHRYGGWYCPDNFGFVPIDIQELDQVPAITDRLPTQEELHDHKSLIAVDTEKYPDARAMDMELPRVGRIYSQQKGMSELVVVIQAIIVSEDTVVGYRFPNGGNGSAWLSEVTFLSEDEVAELGPQPFFFSKSVVNASKEEIWKAAADTDYFKLLGNKFNEQDFFSSEWTVDGEAYLNLETDGEKAKGYTGTVFGNAYLHIDYNRDGFHYSEKLLMIENLEDNTTVLFFAAGPFPQDFDNQNSKWNTWFQTVKTASEAD